jgi:hypothetical protein
MCLHINGTHLGIKKVVVLLAYVIHILSTAVAENGPNAIGSNPRAWYRSIN